jgi:hypothetical protein
VSHCSALGKALNFFFENSLPSAPFLKKFFVECLGLALGKAGKLAENGFGFLALPSAVTIALGKVTIIGHFLLNFCVPSRQT